MPSKQLLKVVVMVVVVVVVVVVMVRNEKMAMC